MERKRIQINLNTQYYEEIKILVKNGRYKSVSEFVDRAVRDLLKYEKDCEALDNKCKKILQEAMGTYKMKRVCPHCHFECTFNNTDLKNKVHEHKFWFYGDQIIKYNVTYYPCPNCSNEIVVDREIIKE